MFAQVIRGRVKDAAAVRAAMDHWHSKLRPGAEGYLGTTAGVAENSTFLAMVRFSSEEAAQDNSRRPEQGEWWEETSRLFEGDATFHDCPTVNVYLRGDPDDAGFVQFMVYQPKDSEAMLDLIKDFEPPAERPEIIGAVVAAATDGTMFSPAYFTTEEEARKGERQEPPPDTQALRARFEELVEDVSYIDLSDPWLFSA